MFSNSLQNKILFILLFSTVNILAATENESESDFESYSESANRTLSGCCFPLPGTLPPGIFIYPGSYENWGKEIRVSCAWIAVPTDSGQVVKLANYAKDHGMKIRALGNSHNWSPILTTPDCSSNVILVHTKLLNSMRIQKPNEKNPLPSIWVECGAWMEHILQYLEDHGYGLTSIPAPGDLTIGGVCAIGGHGAAISADGEIPVKGQGYGSVSNLILSLTAVVWDATKLQYVLKTFSRSDPDATAFLVHLGRCFILDFTLVVHENYYLRCESTTDIPATDLFRDPQSVNIGNRERTFEHFLNKGGRVESILFPFTSKPWLKTWTVTPKKPLTSRPVLHPYNYPMTDNMPSAATTMAKEMLDGNWVKAPEFGQLMYELACAQVAIAKDLWGWSKNLLLYIKASTLRVTATGFSILTTREFVQQTLHEFYTCYKNLLDEFAAQNKYPVNGPLEVRVSGLDDPENIGVQGAKSPSLSSMNSETVHGCTYDVVIWLNVLHFPDTPHMTKFACKLETWLLSKYKGAAGSGCNGLYRPEWTKGWAYTESNGWDNSDVLENHIPGSYSSWWDATTILNKYDPHCVISNSFLDKFLTCAKN